MAPPTVLPTCFLAMSQLQTPKDVPALEHERESLASTLDDESSNSASVQAIVSIPAVERELEPIVTRKELWSYYCMSLRDSLCSCEGSERIFSVL